MQHYDRVCCPNVPGFGVCGGLSRGICTSLSDYPAYDCFDNEDTRYCKAERLLRNRAGPNNINNDLRYKWPKEIFDRVCECNKEYSGYNCMRCNHGYIKDGNNCIRRSSTTFPIRKNFLKLSSGEQNEFITILQMVKNSKNYGVKYAYAVPIEQPTTNERSFATVSLYDAFTTYHYYSNRDKPLITNKNCNNNRLRDLCNNGSCIPDFSHWGPAFLTWHRGYLLCFENEIRHMLSQMNWVGKYYTADNFALHYWDWTDSRRRDNIWSVTGHNKEIIGDITGEFAYWNVVCSQHENDYCNNNDKLCNPTVNFLTNQKINRSIGRLLDKQCLAKAFQDSLESSPPSIDDFYEALKESSYDEDPYWYNSTNRGFRNTLEGFAKLTTDRDGVCTGPGFPFFELHNRLHVYIGGTMSNIVISSNDPIFYLHHSTVDHMYEIWLQKYNGLYKPSEFSYKVTPGHNKKEPLVMLFPRITNEDMHKKSNELGYNYDTLVSTSGSHNSVYEVSICS